MTVTTAVSVTLPLMLFITYYVDVDVVITSLLNFPCLRFETLKANKPAISTMNVAPNSKQNNTVATANFCSRSISSKNHHEVTLLWSPSPIETRRNKLLPLLVLYNILCVVLCVNWGGKQCLMSSSFLCFSVYMVA